jgi:hypothetical protein
MSAGDDAAIAQRVDTDRVKELLELMRTRYNCADEVYELRWLLFGIKPPGAAPEKPQGQRSRGG